MNAIAEHFSFEILPLGVPLLKIQLEILPLELHLLKFST